MKRKKEQRKEALAARDSIPAGERSALSLKVMDNLFSLPQWAAPKGAMFFATMRSEVDTLPMIKAAMERGVRVALPRIAGPGKIEPRWVGNLDADLAPNPLGMREPSESCPQADPADIGIVIVPGAAFDGGGARIGYGGGYYDRFLASTPRALRVAVAFDAQVVDVIESSPQDVPVDILVTESGSRVFYKRLTPADWAEAASRGANAGPDAEAAGPGSAPPCADGRTVVAPAAGGPDASGAEGGEGPASEDGSDDEEGVPLAEPAPSQPRKSSGKTMKKKKHGRRK